MRIGRFQVIEPLAAGPRRMLAAYDPRLDRKVAIELSAAADASEEARALARIGHPNVVRVHEVGEHEGEWFVATDFVRGGTLDTWHRAQVGGTRAYFAQLLGLMLQATQGLAAAHAVGVHGLALAAGDVLVDDEGRLRLRGRTMAAASAESHTSSEPAPEHDAREDQRALCQTFLELGLGGSASATDDPTHVPAWFIRVVRRGMAPSPSDRWPSVEALRAALERGRDRRRRSGLRLGATIGVGTTAAVMLLVSRPESPTSCEPPVDAPSQTWAERSAALIERFETSEIPATRGQGQLAVQRLVQFAAQWDAEHAATCRGAKEELALAEARRACLERASTSFGVVLTEIESLEPKRLKTASTVTLALPELGECRSPSSAPIEGRDGKAREATLRLAQAATLVNLGHTTDAEHIVETLAATGWAGSASVESHGRRIQSHAAYKRGNHERALELALLALASAEQSEDPRLMATAWVEVATSEVARKRFAEAAFAVDRVKHLAHDDHLLLADGEAVLAGIMNARGQPEPAVDSYQAAAALVREELGPQSARLASLYEDTVPALLLAGRFEEAVTVARQAVALFETLGGSQSIRTLRARGTLGMALTELGAHEEAIEQLARAEEGLAANPDAAPEDRAVFGIRHADELGKLGRSDDALAVLDALRVDSLQTPILITRGNILLDAGRASEAVTIYEAVLVSMASDGMHVTELNRAVTHANLALALAQAGRTEEAVALVEPTVAEYQALGLSAARVGGLWIEFVDVHRLAGRLDDAQRAAERGLALLESGEAPPTVLARARSELAATKAAVQAAATRGEAP